MTLAMRIVIRRITVMLLNPVPGVREVIGAMLQTPSPKAPKPEIPQP